MSRTRGEGRAYSEKQGRLVTSGDARREARRRKQAEEAEWAERSGPVVDLTPVCTGREKTDDGRVRHYFTKQDGRWVCNCGEAGEVLSVGEQIQPDVETRRRSQGG